MASTFELLREKNEDAAIITTPWDQLEGKKILQAIEDKSSMEKELLAENFRTENEHHHSEHGGNCTYGCHDHDSEHHHHDHHADEVFSIWSTETPRIFTYDDIQHALSMLDSGDYGAVLRAKGIVPSVDGRWLHFDYVPGEYEVRYGLLTIAADFAP